MVRTQRERLEILEVLVMALDHRQKVFELVDASEDQDEALSAVADPSS